MPEKVAGLQNLDWLRLTDRSLAEWALLCPPTPAEPAHRAHGDGKIGEAVPASPGRVFDAGCGVR